MSQKQYRPHYEHLKNKWTQRQKDIQKTLWEKHKDALAWASEKAKHITVGSMASLLLLAQPSGLQSSSPLLADAAAITQDIDTSSFLITDLQSVVPKEVRELTPEEEEKIGQILSRDFNMKVAAELEDKRLNRSYGYIGAEQHLARYPGDTMATHFDSEEDAQKYYSSGMAPGLGAWGYFAKGSTLTQKDTEREKYYIAVQTFLAPGFMENVREHYEFYKFRKMLLVNPHNGKAIVTVIGDAGPAPWTGKHLGGSPEVMKHLERVDGRQKGPVLYFFIDDPKDTIPLGPITLQ